MASAKQPSAWLAWPRRLEDSACIAVLAVMSALPVAEVLAREALGGGVPGSIAIAQHMVLWVSFLGAAVAARTDRLLALSTAKFVPEAWAEPLHVAAATLATAITTLLCAASLQLVAVDYRFGDLAAWGIPIWVFGAVMPIAFALIVLRLIRHASAQASGRVTAAMGVPAAALFLLIPNSAIPSLIVPLAVLIVAGTAIGMPIFTALGGGALLLFWGDGTPISAVPGEAYRMSTSPMLPALPLFTLAGYIFAEGGSSRRLLRLFAAAVGWMPGGIAIVVILLLAFFTPLTGASGITILAMGGLLLPMLLKSGYSDSHSVGLVTVSGSIGIFLPPSLPVILYAYYANLNLSEMFVAGLLPGLLLIAAVAAWGVRGGGLATERQAFSGKELAVALWRAKWEVLLPCVIVFGIFGGFATLVEASAMTVIYALLVECLLFRELSWRQDLPRIAVESAAMIGGFMIILSVALGFTNYLIVAQIPMHLLDSVSALIDSPYVFLLALNLFLIVIGALMDIYSAIVVVVPLIVPLAAAYGIHPVHLGIVFLANMQLGYLMPPMGENLFLSAYRFKQPLGDVYRDVLPFLGIVLAVVLLITYLPALSLYLLRFVGG